MDFKKRSDKLKEIIGKIQCHGCEKVPAPNDLNRYSCNESHYLCQDCKNSMDSKCPCGPPIGVNVPSGIFTLLLESLSLPWYCRYYPKGCQEICEQADLEDHQMGCIFRPVNRPYILCKKHVL